MSLFPPPLVLSSAPNASVAPASSSSSSSSSPSSGSRPNLMPFHIEYTGPGNVDGYLVMHDAARFASDQDARVPLQADSSAKKSGGNGNDEGKESDLLSHFRGRRMYATKVDLPPGWIGLTCTLRQDVQSSTASDAGPSGYRGAASTSAALLSGGDDSQRSHADPRLDEEERQELQRRRQAKRRKLAAKANAAAEAKKKKKKPAAMASFSMDDDDDEEQEQEGYDEEAGVADADSYDGLADDADKYGEDGASDDDGRALHSGHSNAGDSHDAVQAEGLLEPVQTQPSTITSLQACSSSSSSSGTWDAVNIWNPDGPLDVGDEEFIKVLGEMRSVSDLVSQEPRICIGSFDAPGKLVSVLSAKLTNRYTLFPTRCLALTASLVNLIRYVAAGLSGIKDSQLIYFVQLQLQDTNAVGSISVMNIVCVCGASTRSR